MNNTKPQFDFNTFGSPIQKSDGEFVNKQGYISRVIDQYGKAGQDVTSAIQQGAGQMQKPGILGKITGAIKSGLGTVGGVARAAFAPVTEAPVIKQGLEKVGEAIAPTVQDGLNTEAGQKLLALKNQYPEIAKSLQDVFDLATLGAGKAVEKPIQVGLEQGAKTAGEIASNIPRATSKLVTVAKETIQPKIPVEKAIGEVLQGTTKEIKAGTEGLNLIDTAGIKTYKEVNEAIGKKIPELARVVDNELAQDTTKSLLDNLVTVKPTKMGGQVSINYVENALNQLDELYTKTGDLVAKADIQDLIKTAKTQGLTKVELNDIARTYGSEFGEKAFSKLGDPLTSVNAQMFENTRRGIKELVRSGLKSDVAIKADKAMSSLYNTQALIKRNVEAVNKLMNKIEERGLIEKIGYNVSKYADILTGGTLRGFIGGLLPRGAGYKTLNALDLENLLERNLKIIRDASKAKTGTEFKKITSQLFDENSSVKNTASNLSNTKNQVMKSGANTINSNKAISESISKKPFVNKQGGFISTGSKENSIKDILQSKYKDVDFSIYERDGEINLSKIIVPKSSRNTGIGTNAMKDLVKYADETGKKITLTPSSDYGGSKARLVDFYKRFGFVENTGKNKDFSTRELMYRPATKSVSKELQPLYKEAQKYKSAEKFVKDKAKYARSGELSGDKVGSGGIFLSDNVDSVKELNKYSGNKIEDYYIQDIPDEAKYVASSQFEAVDDFLPESRLKDYFKVYSKEGYRPEKYIDDRKGLIRFLDSYDKELADRGIDTFTHDGKRKFIELIDSKIKQGAEKKGIKMIQYTNPDEIDFFAPAGERNDFVIFDKNLIKTKPQLEQIWKEANGKASTKQGMSAVNPLTVIGGATAIGAGIMSSKKK